VTGWILFGEFFLVASAFILGRSHADEWTLHAIARVRGGQWFTARRRCPGCSRQVHVMRESGTALVAGNPDGYLCCACASGRQR
jgi:hypothetical protein